MDVSFATSNLDLLVAAMALFVSLLTYLRLKKLDKAGTFQALHERIDEVDEHSRARHDNVNTRLTRLEAAIESAPTAEQFSQVREGVARTEEQIKGIALSFEQVAHTSQSLDNRLAQLLEDRLANSRHRRAKS